MLPGPGFGSLFCRRRSVSGGVSRSALFGGVLAALAGSLAPLAASPPARCMRTGRQPHRLGDVQRSARPNAVAGEMVPRTQLLHRHAEPIGDRDQRVGATGGVTLLTGPAAG